MDSDHPIGLPKGNWKLGNWKLELGNWGTGNWNWEMGNWKLELESWGEIIWDGEFGELEMSRSLSVVGNHSKHKTFNKFLFFPPQNKTKFQTNKQTNPSLTCLVVLHGFQEEPRGWSHGVRGESSGILQLQQLLDVLRGKLPLAHGHQSPDHPPHLEKHGRAFESCPRGIHEEILPGIGRECPEAFGV